MASGVNNAPIKSSNLQQPQNARYSYWPGIITVTAIMVIGAVVFGAIGNTGNSVSTDSDLGYSCLISGGIYVAGLYLNNRVVTWLNNRGSSQHSTPQGCVTKKQPSIQ